MKINTDKSHFLITKATNTQINLTIDNTPLAQTNKTTLLGFTINQTLTWTDHLDKLISKVAKNCRLLLATRHLMSQTTAIRFYNHFIHSHLLYGIEIYYPLTPCSKLKSLHTLQKKALKYALRVPRRTSTKRVTEDTQVLPLPQLATYSGCILAFKIHRKLCPPYLSNIFKPTTVKVSVTTRDLNKIPSSHDRSPLDHFTMSSFNSLPQNLRAQKSLLTFKRKLKSHLIKTTS